MTNPDEFLTGGGGGPPGAKFDTIGASVEGTITDPPVIGQQTEMGTGKPLYFDSGQPMQQLIVTIQTKLQDSLEDDGRRRLFVKGSTDPALKSLRAAVAGAVSSTGATGLEVGGWLRVTRGPDRMTASGFRAYTYDAQYRRPDGGAFLSQQQADPWATQQPSASPAVAHQRQQPPAPQAPAGLTPDQQAAFNNLTPQQQAALAGMQPQNQQQQPSGGMEPPF